MFGRRIFLLGAAYFMVGFTRPSGAAESRTLVAFFSRLPEMPSGADAVTHATASTGNVEEAAKTIGARPVLTFMLFGHQENIPSFTDRTLLKQRKNLTKMRDRH